MVHVRRLVANVVMAVKETVGPVDVCGVDRLVRRRVVGHPRRIRRRRCVVRDIDEYWLRVVRDMAGDGDVGDYRLRVARYLVCHWERHARHRVVLTPHAREAVQRKVVSSGLIVARRSLAWLTTIGHPVRCDSNLLSVLTLGSLHALTFHATTHLVHAVHNVVGAGPDGRTDRNQGHKGDNSERHRLLRPELVRH